MHDERQSFLEDVARELRRPVRIGPPFDVRVMRAVRRLPAYRRIGLWARILRPRTITVTPLPLAGLAAGVLAVVSLGIALYTRVPRPDGTARSRIAAMFLGRPVAHADQHVQFVLVAPSAKTVAVVGDFNHWDGTRAAYRAQEQGGGVWSVTVPIPAGHHRYSFVVDDSLWVADPTAPRVIDDDYGLPNSAIVVGDLP